MTTPIPSQLFLNIRAQDKGLLFQFLFAQFLKIYGATQDLETLTVKLHLEEANFWSSVRSKRFAGVGDILSRLAGPAVEFLPTFPWNTDNGALAFLFHYSEVLCAKTRGKNRDFQRIMDYTDKAYRHGKKARDMWEEWKQVDVEATHSQQKSFAHAITQVVKNIQKVAKQIERTLPSFSQDEKVAFFLLRHMDLLDALYGPRFVEHVLREMYHDDLHEAEQFMLRRFARRGFDHLIPVISSKIAALNG